MNVSFENYYVYCVYNNQDIFCAWSISYDICKKYVYDRELKGFTIKDRLVSNKKLEKTLHKKFGDIELISYRNISCFDSETYLIDDEIEKFNTKVEAIVRKRFQKDVNIDNLDVEFYINQSLDRLQVQSIMSLFYHVENATLLAEEVKSLDDEFKNIVKY